MPAVFGTSHPSEGTEGSSQDTGDAIQVLRVHGKLQISAAVDTAVDTPKAQTGSLDQFHQDIECPPCGESFAPSCYPTPQQQAVVQ